MIPVIASLRGTIQSKDADGIVVEVGGVGYRLSMSTRNISSIGEPLDEVFVYTYLHVREDVLSLYGFTGPEERDFFENLKGVSGVGPKVAIAILSAYGPDDLRRAVLSRDVALFQSISGIGKKTAERLVLELRDRVGELAEPAAAPGGGNGNYYTAREALISLGYNFAEAEAALAGADADMDVEELVRNALKRIGSA